MPTLLAIETSTPTGSVALVNNDKIISELFTDSNETHAATLLPTIEKLLSSSQTDINSIDGIAVSIGPGAFTGLRVGISTAQGLAQTLKLPIYSIPTLEAFAYSALSSNKQIFVTLDARKDEIYGALFTIRNKILSKIIPETAASPDEWVIMLSEKLTDSNFVVGGPGYLKYKELFKEKFGNKIAELAPSLDSPRASNVGFFGLKMMREEHRGTDYKSLRGLYLRHP